MFEMTRLLLTAETDNTQGGIAAIWADLAAPFLDELQEAGKVEFWSSEERDKVSRVPLTTGWTGTTARLYLYWRPGQLHSTVEVECDDWVASTPDGWTRIGRSSLAAEIRFFRLYVNGKSVSLSRPGTVFQVVEGKRVHRFFLEEDRSARTGLRFTWCQHKADTQLPIGNIDEVWKLPEGVELVSVSA